MPFDLVSPYPPAGDQPRAIRELSQGLARGDRYQTLLGVTGSGKTFTMAHVLADFNRPTLVLSHNKTLAAQLYGELKSFFPHNAVEYFISYYDYYQPEAYVPTTDTYIEKDASINEDIDRLRLRATSSLMERDDVVIVATVSAIYGLGDPRSYREQMVTLTKGQKIARDDILRSLVKIQYSRNDMGLERGTFRVRGDTVEILPAYEEQGVRVEMWGDEIERISKINPLTGDTIANLEKSAIYPAKHFVTSRPTIERAVALIREELVQRLSDLRASNKLLEAQRLESRTDFDIEMMLEIGTSAGIENYSRHLSGRTEGGRTVRPVRGQVDDLLNEIRIRERRGERVLVTTLTKRMAEDLADYLQQMGVRVRYMHADIDAIERMEIVRGLRLGEFDVLIGINLLREGLDLPEVSLVAILDADQEGFLRSDRSLIQTVGRAARHLNGRAIFYADRMTGSMERCIGETDRRRELQQNYNKEHGITPASVVKSVDQVRFITRVADARTEREEREREKTRRVAEASAHYGADNIPALILELEAQMREAATNLDFETAARIRDELFELKAKQGKQEKRGSLAGLHGREMPAHRHVVPSRATKGHLTLTEPQRQNWGEELRRATSAPLLATGTRD